MLSSLLIFVLSALPGPAALPADLSLPAAPVMAPGEGPGAGPLALGPDGAAPVRAAQNAAQNTAHSAATDRAAERVAATRRARQQAGAEQAKLARQYEAQLDEIDRLKRQRASWRRDRLIRARMSESHATAQALEELAERIRRLDALLRSRERALVEAIAREYQAGPAPLRRAQLDRWQQSARRHLRGTSKKIVLPDDQLDPLADPEELEYQAALIRESEEELIAELTRLARQTDHYQHMADLRRTRSRASELGAFGDDRPRRSAGHANTSAPAVPSDSDDRGGDGTNEDPAGGGSAPPPAPPEDQAPPSDLPDESDGPGIPPTGEPESQIMFDIILADVVDAPTLEALRTAERSSDPALKAQATKRAHAQVRARLERLRKQRQLIQKRARELRRP